MKDIVIVGHGGLAKEVAFLIEEINRTQPTWDLRGYISAERNNIGAHSGKYTVVTFGCAILAHDWVNGVNRDVHIGDNCFIGAHSIILPGVTIGDSCVVAAGSVVARDVPAGSLVAGNPARVLEHNVETTRYGVRVRRAV